jgi:hypothetical protein
MIGLDIGGDERCRHSRRFTMKFDLKIERRKLQLSQTDAARLFGYPRSRIQNFESSWRPPKAVEIGHMKRMLLSYAERTAARAWARAKAMQEQTIAR